MQWDASASRGFSRAEPWLPYGPAAINVQDQLGDPASLLSLYRRALALRKREPSLHSGALQAWPEDPDVFGFTREMAGSRRIAVVVNTSLTARVVSLPGPGTVLLSTGAAFEGSVAGESLHLPPLDAAWVALS
jgi:glycosidase